MTLVLLNDVDDSRMLHLFFVHMCAIIDLWQSSTIGRLYWETKQVTKSSVYEHQFVNIRWRKMLKHWNAVLINKAQSSSGAVIQVEGVKRSILVFIIWLDSSPWLSLQNHNMVNAYVYGPCSSVHVSTKVLIKHLVSKSKHSRKCDKTLQESYLLIYSTVRHSLPYHLATLDYMYVCLNGIWKFWEEVFSYSSSEINAQLHKWHSQQDKQ